MVCLATHINTQQTAADTHRCSANAPISGRGGGNEGHRSVAGNRLQRSAPADLGTQQGLGRVLWPGVPLASSSSSSSHGVSALLREKLQIRDYRSCCGACWGWAATKHRLLRGLLRGLSCIRAKTPTLNPINHLSPAFLLCTSTNTFSIIIWPSHHHHHPITTSSSTRSTPLGNDLLLFCCCCTSNSVSALSKQLLPSLQLQPHTHTPQPEWRPG